MKWLLPVIFLLSVLWNRANGRCFLSPCQKALPDNGNDYLPSPPTPPVCPKGFIITGIEEDLDSSRDEMKPSSCADDQVAYLCCRPYHDYMERLGKLKKICTYTPCKSTLTKEAKCLTGVQEGVFPCGKDKGIYRCCKMAPTRTTTKANRNSTDQPEPSETEAPLEEETLPSEEQTEDQTSDNAPDDDTDDTSR